MDPDSILSVWYLCGELLLAAILLGVMVYQLGNPFTANKLRRRIRSITVILLIVDLTVLLILSLFLLFSVMNTLL